MSNHEFSAQDRHLRKLLETEDLERLEHFLDELTPVEVASGLLPLKLPQQMAILNALETEKASDVLCALQQHPPILAALLEEIPTEQLRVLIKSMPSDDATDVVGAMDDDKAEEVLEALPSEDRQQITSLMQYDEESAGGIMNPYVVTVRNDQTVAEAVDSIRTYVEEKDMQAFYSVYVVDEHFHLVGFTSLTDLLLAAPTIHIRDIMNPDVVTVDVDMDQEEVARIAQEYDLVVVPVIDKHLKLIGRITIDDLMDVLYAEYQEDLGHIAGTGDEEVLETSVLRASRDRLPWLLLGLLGGLSTAAVMSYYEHTLARVPQVVYFIPLIAAIGGNIGIQSSSIVVRGLATGEIRQHDLFLRLWKELRVGLLNGIVCSLVLVGMVWFFSQRVEFGITAGAALLVVIATAATVGSLVPFILKRINIDPALATGPFITTTNDVLGIAIYLFITLETQNWNLL